jgi:hypothetical protein
MNSQRQGRVFEPGGAQFEPLSNQFEPRSNNFETGHAPSDANHHNHHLLTRTASSGQTRNLAGANEDDPLQELIEIIIFDGCKLWYRAGGEAFDTFSNGNGDENKKITLMMTTGNAQR